jgi:hypothetical protein
VLHVVALIVVIFKCFMVFMKLLFLLLKIFDVVIVSKGLGGYEIDVLFGCSESTDESVAVV